MPKGSAGFNELLLRYTIAQKTVERIDEWKGLTRELREILANFPRDQLTPEMLQAMLTMGAESAKVKDAASPEVTPELLRATRAVLDTIKAKGKH